MSEPEVCNKDWNQIIKNWIVVPGVGASIISIVFDRDSLIAGQYEAFAVSTLVSFLFWTSIANGSAYINVYINKRWSWLENPVKRVILAIIPLLVYTIIISIIIVYIYVEFYFDRDFFEIMEKQGLVKLIKFPILITCFIALWQHGQGFLIAWRQSAVDIERLETENLKSKFEFLKSQVNPHFLFNSLNTLSSLIYSNQDKAVNFIQKLSEVYRYVLQRQNEEVVDLESEIAFLKSYVFLNKIRFGENFHVNYTNMGDSINNFSVPPAVLQMLLENSIKHNEISKENRLNVEVKLEGQSIIIKNNINPISTPKQDSNGLGLSNIISRYGILSNKKIEITQTKSSFQVKVPLLNFSS